MSNNQPVPCLESGSIRHCEEEREMGRKQLVYNTEKETLC